MWTETDVRGGNAGGWEITYVIQGRFCKNMLRIPICVANGIANGDLVEEVGGVCYVFIQHWISYRRLYCMYLILYKQNI